MNGDVPWLRVPAGFAGPAPGTGSPAPPLPRDSESRTPPNMMRNPMTPSHDQPWASPTTMTPSPRAVTRTPSPTRLALRGAAVGTAPVKVSASFGSSELLLLHLRENALLVLRQWHGVLQMRHRHS